MFVSMFCALPMYRISMWRQKLRKLQKLKQQQKKLEEIEERLKNVEKRVTLLETFMLWVKTVIGLILKVLKRESDGEVQVPPDSYASSNEFSKTKAMEKESLDLYPSMPHDSQLGLHC